MTEEENSNFDVCWKLYISVSFNEPPLNEQILGKWAILGKMSNNWVNEQVLIPMCIMGVAEPSSQQQMPS